MKNADYAKALGAAIRHIRKERKLTLTDLHYETRINRQSVTEIEQGVVFVRLDTILRICQALDVKPAVLFALADSN